MGLFDFAKVCLFSEVSGVVTLDGKPVADVEVVRTAQMGHDNIYTDKTVTDGQGRYRFPARFTHSVYKIAPVEPVITQKITFYYQDKEYLGWFMTKRDYEVNTELGHPLNLTCALDSEPKMRTGGPRIEGVLHYTVVGLCVGPGMFNEKPMPQE